MLFFPSIHRTLYKTQPTRKLPPYYTEAPKANIYLALVPPFPQKVYPYMLLHNPSGTIMPSLWSKYRVMRFPSKSFCHLIYIYDLQYICIIRETMFAMNYPSHKTNHGFTTVTLNYGFCVKSRVSLNVSLTTEIVV